MYSDRKSKARELELAFENVLNKTGAIWRYSGIEATSPPAYQTALRAISSTCPLAALLRYTPDYEAIINGRIVYFDCKSSETIERQCYETYLTLIAQGRTVKLIYRHSGLLVAINPADLVLVDDPSYRNSWAIPTEGPWRQPRELPPEIYARWQAAYPYASGTDCAYIDFSATALSPLPRK